MRVETYIPGLSKNTIDIVKHAEALGYDALVSGELNNEPFLPVLMGLEHSQMIVRTGLAIAFPRSPMTVANMGWDLQSFGGGRFQLGLGTQVKGHNERRFSVPWSPPAPRMREYILASDSINQSFILHHRPAIFRFNVASWVIDTIIDSCSPATCFVR